MKGITRRNDGRYMIRLSINGVKVYQYALTFAQAKKKLEQLKKEQKKFKKQKIDKIEQNKKTSNGLSLDEFTKQWLEIYKKPFVNERTYKDTQAITKHFLNVMGNLSLKQITTLKLQEYYNSIKASRSKERVFLYFNAVMQKASDLNLINKNPFCAIIKDKKQKHKNDAYTYDEQVKILSAVKNTDIEHEIYIYLMCGCRPNELPRNADFDFENNIINIYGTKNENAKHRQIEMSQAFADYMKEYLKLNCIKKEPYVSKKFITICKDIGIKKPLLYRLRHTFATNHFTIGTQPKQVQQWLGHSSISLTLDTYTDIDKTATREKILKLYNNFYYEKI